MYKKIISILLFSFLIIGAVSAANDFKLNDGFNAVNEYVAENEENGMTFCIWDYDDELIREGYLENGTDYIITEGDNNTYNTTYNSNGAVGSIISYVGTGNAVADHGVLEVAEINGQKYIFYSYIESGTEDDFKTCYDELMKFNENNNIEPLADVI